MQVHVNHAPVDQPRIHKEQDVFNVLLEVIHQMVSVVEVAHSNNILVPPVHALVQFAGLVHKYPLTKQHAPLAQSTSFPTTMETVYHVL